jgi:hypothetical protein
MIEKAIVGASTVLVTPGLLPSQCHTDYENCFGKAEIYAKKA